MLFNSQGFREFFATQSNGEPRKVAYEISDCGKSVVRAVDGLPISEYPLSPQFEAIVVSWCDDHRANLHKHDDYRMVA
ncbi:hypothetical protein GCM10009007_02990 [Formosimonas limnophila]|uniref:Uncharacterized protein n=1 Tax=Formosimonas limnophila TaxID=1384487 RepID=A0A8J3CMA4_9BURK|nr:hypothetical protein [Formosimonas limnophila]GHA65954.1 hypothetical protein GCM10009007_02990 [Formosimonas limnophila]